MSNYKSRVLNGTLFPPISHWGRLRSNASVISASWSFNPTNNRSTRRFRYLIHGINARSRAVEVIQELFIMTSNVNKPERQEIVTDKQINEREDIYVKSCLTEQEYREGKVRHYLTILILPFYMLLLITSLVASWYTGSESYLKCFDGVLKYVTPLIAFVYSYYFYTRNRIKRAKK